MIEELKVTLKARMVELDQDVDHGLQNRLADENRIDEIRKILQFIHNMETEGTSKPLSTL